MTPLVTKMTAAAMLPAAYGVETTARLMSITARHTSSMLSTLRTRTLPALAQEAEEAADGLEAERKEVLDRASDALQDRAETMEAAATDLVADAASAPDHTAPNVSSASGTTDDRPGAEAASTPDEASKGGHDAAPRQEAGPDSPGLRPVDGAMTAAATVAERLDEPAAPAKDPADLVAEATGQDPKPLDELLPVDKHPAA